MTQLLVNNFRTTVASTFGIGDLTLNLTSATGLPTLTGDDFFTLTVFRLTGVVESGWETVKVTARVGLVCTVERSYEGAAASQFLAGDIVSARFSAKAYERKADIEDLGTAAALNVPATGDATTGQVVKGTDSRLTDARTPTTHTHSIDALTAGAAADKDTLVFDTASGKWVNRALSYLTNLVHSIITSAPNATVPVAKMLATNAATNVDIAISAKGTGSLMSQAPDNTTAGGNKRGIKAVDWQMSRTTVSQVASGDFSTISGGNSNKASAAYATIAGGLTNIASGIRSFIGGGDSNGATGYYSTVSGGNQNGANAESSTIAGGAINGLDGYASSCPGGTYAYDRAIIGAQVWGGAVGAGGGHMQKGDYLLALLTTSATPAILSTNNQANDVSNSLVMPDFSAYLMKVRVVARNLANGAISTWEGNALFTRQSGVATTTKIAGTLAAIGNTGGFTVGAAPTILADTALGSIKITVTGIAATNIQWLCHVDSLEICNA